MYEQIFVSACIMILLDTIYLSFNRKLLENQVFDIQRKTLKMNYAPAIACYILLVLGVNYFIIREKRTIYDAFLFGIIIYGVYETTNYAIFSEWKLSTALTDTLWGGILIALTTYLTYRIT